MTVGVIKASDIRKAVLNSPLLQNSFRSGDMLVVRPQTASVSSVVDISLAIILGIGVNASTLQVRDFLTNERRVVNTWPGLNASDYELLYAGVTHAVVMVVKVGDQEYATQQIPFASTVSAPSLPFTDCPI